METMTIGVTFEKTFVNGCVLGFFTLFVFECLVFAMIYLGDHLK